MLPNYCGICRFPMVSMNTCQSRTMVSGQDIFYHYLLTNIVSIRVNKCHSSPTDTCQNNGEPQEIFSLREIIANILISCLNTQYLR